MDIESIAVIGAGQMGGGIAEVVATHGIAALLCDESQERAQAGKARILKRLERRIEKGELSAEAAQAAAARVVPQSFEEAVRRASLVIEAATENPELKRELFRRADALASPSTILASNTSSISLTMLARETRRPSQVIGMHFMNPVPIMKLVELVRAVQTSDETLATVRALAERLDKVVILSTDSPGFIMNRMLYPFINEACFAVDEQIGSIEDIDRGARLGLNHPLGPLELADLIGLDTLLAIGQVLHEQIGDDKYRPARSLRNLVAAGWLGRKAGRGFYRYDENGKRMADSRGAEIQAPGLGGKA